MLKVKLLICEKHQSFEAKRYAMIQNVSSHSSIWGMITYYNFRVHDAIDGCAKIPESAYLAVSTCPVHFSLLHQPWAFRSLQGYSNWPRTGLSETYYKRVLVTATYKPLGGRPLW